MILIYVNADDSVAYAGDLEIPPDRLAADTRKVEIGKLELKAALPPGVSEETIGELAHRGYYFRDGKFGLESPDSPAVDTADAPAS